MKGRRGARFWVSEMTLGFVLLLGLVQALTEFLPVSSSGHLSILQNLFGLEKAGQPDLLLDVMLHFGTLISVAVMYRRDIRDMAKALGGVLRRRSRGSPPVTPAERGSARLILLVLIGSLPLLAVIPVREYIESLYGSLTFVGAALIVTGIVLFASDRTEKGEKDENSASLLDALLVGCLQAAATAPGISRSGMTVGCGLMRGFERSFAVRFSFLVSVPAVLGANVLSLVGALRDGIDLSMLPIYLAGAAAAAAVGCFAIRLVSLLAEKDRFGRFAWYCWAVGAAVLTASFFI